ncbi:MAG: hypothetical protein M1838_004284 [Thelocarpon superellum]|nr:MAG: hypothetical protein M1838_004284 [Thelocarpon superellum]
MGPRVPWAGVLASVLLWADVMRVAAEASDTAFHYVDGKPNATIEWITYRENEPELARGGMNDSQSQRIIAQHNQTSQIYEPTVTTVDRWLPPLDQTAYETQRIVSENAVINVLPRDGLQTLLWEGDEFWIPACSRMALELSRFQIQGANVGQEANNRGIKTVTIKHYGWDNHNAPVETFLTVKVVDEGSHVASTFYHNCASWFGGVLKVAFVMSNSSSSPSSSSGPLQPLMMNETDNATGQNSQTTLAVPPFLEGTVGGVLAIQADDQSNFTLWVEPAVGDDKDQTCSAP